MVARLFGGGSFSGNTPSLSAMLPCWRFQSRFIDNNKSIGGHFGCSGALFSSIWGNMGFFIRVFSFEMVFLLSGAALALCVPSGGAFLFSACWLSLRSPWVAFGLAGSGRAALDQGSFWLFFWVAPLAPEMGTWILPKCTKTNGFGPIYAQRVIRRNRFM